MDLELDKKILAYALKDKKYTMELSNSVNVKYFSVELQWLFTIINNYFVNPKFKEIPSRDIILEQLNKEYSEDLVNNYIVLFDEIINCTINLSEFNWHLEKLRARYNSVVQDECLKKIIKIKKSEIDGQEKILNSNEILKETIVNIDSIYKKQIYREGSLASSAKERFERYQQVEENPEIARGILTGFREFDRKTNGLHNGELMIVAGSTGTGKSVLMHNIGVNAYLGSNNPFGILDNFKNDGHNVLYFSLEMPKDSMERRLDSCMGGLYYNQLRDGILSEDDKRKYFNLTKFQLKYDKNFYTVDMPKGATVREIELKYVEISEFFKPDLVIIDYMGIMSPSNKSDNQDWLDLGYISAELHEFARVYNIPVITGSQVNRPKEGTKQEYTTNRLARSSMVPNNANIIIQIACRDDEDIRSDMEIFITKMRDGEKGGFTLNKDFAKMKVLDMSMEVSIGDDEEDDDVI
jgi:replicative DNA helicase